MLKPSSTANKSASTIIIRPLEGINKELIYQQRMNRPFKVIQNLPVSKTNDSLPDYTVLKHPLSVKDSSVLYNSLIVSRFNWIHHIFQTYWTRREQIIIGADINKKDKMVRFCDPLMFSGVHTFQIKLFFLKDDEREKAYHQELLRKKEERLKRKQEKIEELKRKREEKEREERERVEKERQERERVEKERVEKERLEKERLETESLQNKLGTRDDEGRNIKSKEEVIIIQQNQFQILDTKSRIEPMREGEYNSTVAQNDTDVQDNQQLQRTENQNQTKIGNIPIESEAKIEDKPNSAVDTQQANEIKISNNVPEEKEEGKKEDLSDQLDKNITICDFNNTTTVNKLEHGSQEQFQKSISVIPLKSAESNLPDDKGVSTTKTNEEKKLTLKKAKIDTKDIMANPESAIMIQNLNVLAKNDSHLNTLMKEVASGGASTDKILEFQKYIQKAKDMGDVTGYMEKLRQKQKKKSDPTKPTKTKEEREREKELRRKAKELKAASASVSAPVIKLPVLSPEEAKKKEEDLLRRALEMKQEQERVRLEKHRIREEKEKEKLRLKQEKAEKKAKEKEKRELLKQQAKEEREREKERKRSEKLAEKEKAKLERLEKMKERQLLKEKEKLEQKAKVKLESSKRSVSADLKKEEEDNEDDDSFDDRMGKLNDENISDDLWNDKLSPLQERYSQGASLVFEFQENTSSRFIIPRDTIYEIIDNEESDETENDDVEIKIEDSNSDSKQARPKSPYVTILASFLLVHNQNEIDGWDRREAEAKKAKEEDEKRKLEAQKAEEEESQKNTIAENARKRRRKKSTWGTNKRSTRATKKAKELEVLRREEENYHEEDEDLEDLEGSPKVKQRPLPIFSSVTLTFSKIPYRFADFILNSGNTNEESRKNMEEILRIGERVPLNELWYQIDGIRDELLGETLRYNLNRLDYTSCGKKGRVLFHKRFGKGGRS